MEHEQLINLTADIVAAHVENNSVAVSGLPDLIQQVHQALASLGSSKIAAPAEKKAIVSISSSIKPDYLICMECGAQHKLLKRHIMTAHQMTPEQYRAGYGLPRDYPMIAPNYLERRRTLASSFGLGRGDTRRAATADANAEQNGRPKGGRARSAVAESDLVEHHS